MTAGTYQVMAEVASSGNAETPGVVRPRTTTITDAIVDHKRFGANVIYSISATDG